MNICTHGVKICGIYMRSVVKRWVSGVECAIRADREGERRRGGGECGTGAGLLCAAVGVLFRI